MDRKRIASELTLLARQLVVAAPKLDGLVRKFEALQVKYSEFGAADSEPNSVFASLMAKAVAGENWPGVQSGGWYLYSSMSGWKRVEKVLTNAAKKLFETLQNAPYKDVRELAKYYGWDERW